MLLETKIWYGHPAGCYDTQYEVQKCLSKFICQICVTFLDQKFQKIKSSIAQKIGYEGPKTEIRL